MRLYECVIIFDVQAADAVRDTMLKEFSGVVADSGGTVQEIVPFGIRTLALELKGRHRGDYRIVRFSTGGETLQRIDRMLRLKEEVLRFMVARYTPPKPKKEKPNKKKDESGQTEIEGEVGHGKSEQGVPDRQPDAAA